MAMSIGAGGGEIAQVFERNQEATLYVGNLENQVDDDLLWELFVQCGPIKTVSVPKDKLTGNHQGYGFVEFTTEQDADYALKVMNMVKLYGKPIRLNKAAQDRRNFDVGANLFVGNLDPDVDEKTLFDTFSSFGNIISSNLMRDPETGNSRGFGFVSFDSFEASDAALAAMNGQFICNRPIHVSYAYKKDTRGERHGSGAERLLAANRPAFSASGNLQQQQAKPLPAALSLQQPQQQQQQQQPFQNHLGAASAAPPPLPGMAPGLPGSLPSIPPPPFLVPHAAAAAAAAAQQQQGARGLPGLSPFPTAAAASRTPPPSQPLGGSARTNTASSGTSEGGMINHLPNLPLPPGIASAMHNLPMGFPPPPMFFMPSRTGMAPFPPLPMNLTPMPPPPSQ